MVQNVNINNIKTGYVPALNKHSANVEQKKATFGNAQNVYSYQPLNDYDKVITQLSAKDTEKYVYLVNYLKDAPISQNSENTSAIKQLDCLLKNGKLLNKSKNDNSTTLDNLYLIATKQRVYGLNPKTIITNTLDLLMNPRLVTQNFGNIPDNEKERILSSLPDGHKIKYNPDLINIEESGVCAAASNEVNMADKYPAEFARWIEGLSGENKSVTVNCPLSTISSDNPLGALSVINVFKTTKKSFDYNQAQLIVKPDNNAYVRACIQNNDWDLGERNIVDVLIQSAIMQLGSQNTYNSLTDTRAGDFSASDKGLIEVEKTYVESLIKNRNITSLIYQNLDSDKNIIGYNCPFEVIEKQIKDTIDMGDDVVIGTVLTNEDIGITKKENYNPQIDGAPNQIINGHEITIVDYKQDNLGKTVFICVDTDDNNPDFVEYDADYLIPKIHHGGYPQEIVEDDIKAYPNLQY